MPSTVAAAGGAHDDLAARSAQLHCAGIEDGGLAVLRARRAPPLPFFFLPCASAPSSPASNATHASPAKAATTLVLPSDSIRSTKALPLMIALLARRESYRKLGESGQRPGQLRPGRCLPLPRRSPLLLLLLLLLALGRGRSALALLLLLLALLLLRGRRRGVAGGSGGGGTRRRRRRRRSTARGRPARWSNPVDQAHRDRPAGGRLAQSSLIAPLTGGFDAASNALPTNTVLVAS